MTEGRPDDAPRVVAWAQEMRRVHDRLREALEVAHDSLDGDAAASLADPLLHCWGFCTALDGHHTGEDAVLFPALLAARPDLAPVVERLTQDHAMVHGLLQELQAALREDAAPDEVRGHLDGIGAIMESHFRYEERTLLAALDGVGDLDTTPGAALGPLAG